MGQACKGPGHILVPHSVGQDSGVWPHLTTGQPKDQKERETSSGERSVLCHQAWRGQVRANCSLRKLECASGVSLRPGDLCAGSLVR